MNQCFSVDVIQNFFVNFQKHGTISKTNRNIVKNQLTGMGNNTAKKLTAIKVLASDLITVRSQQNKIPTGSLIELGGKDVSLNYSQQIVQNIATTENTSDNDIKMIDDTQELLEEFNKDITVSDSSEETLDDVDVNSKEEQSIKFEIPRFDLQDLIQGFENYEVTELIDSNYMHSPDELVLNNNGDTKDSHPIDVKTNVQDIETISISSEDSQAHVNLKPEENIDDGPNEKEEPRNVNNENCEPITNVVFIDDSDNVGTKDEKNDEPKNVNEGNEEIFQNVFNDSYNDCGYHSSDFEFITEDEAKTSGIIAYKSENLEKKVKKLRRIKTIEIAVNQFSEQEISSSKTVHTPINNVQGNTELFSLYEPAGFRTNLTQTNSEITELNKPSTEIKGKLPETINPRHGFDKFQPNSSRPSILGNSDSNNFQLQNNTIHYQRYDPVMNPDPNILVNSQQSNNDRRNDHSELNSQSNIDRKYDPRKNMNSLGSSNIFINSLGPTQGNDIELTINNFNCGPYLNNDCEMKTLKIDTDDIIKDEFTNLSEIPEMNNFDHGPSNFQVNIPGLYNPHPESIDLLNIPETSNYARGFQNLQDFPGQSDIQRIPEANSYNRGFDVGFLPITQGNVSEINFYGSEFRNLPDFSGPSNIQRFPEANHSGFNVDPVTQENSHHDSQFRNLPDFPGPSNMSFPEIPDPTIARWRAFQERTRNQFILDYSYRDNHIMLRGVDYHRLFDPNLNPLPLGSRQMENKSTRSMGMMAEYDGIGFDMRMMQESESEDDEVKEEADESAQIILEMYPEMNGQIARRKF